MIPAYNAGPLLQKVVHDLDAAKKRADLEDVVTLVIDDGCTDESFNTVENWPVELLRHEENQGKGAALHSGLRWAQERQIKMIVTLDADDQHPVTDAIRLFLDEASDHLVLAVRNLKEAGAPRPNQLSNAFSNWILSLFGGQRLLDTQCGLRRYPVIATLDLGASHPGYAFESEVVLRAARKGLPIKHVPAEVHYPEESRRISHFDSVKDPAKNVLRVVTTTLCTTHHRATRRWGRRAFIALLVVGLGIWIKQLLAV